MKPEQLSIEDQATEHVRQYAALERLGLVMRFSDTPPGVLFVPMGSDSGPAEVLYFRALGRELLAYADDCERRLPTSAGQTTHRTEAPPPSATPGHDMRMAALEAQLATLTKELGKARAPDVPMAPGPDAYTYTNTTPTPGERRPDPVAPR